MHMDKQPAVYIITNKKDGTLYIGMTTNIIRRIWEHKQGIVKGFSQRYNLKNLVWFELMDTIEDAAVREKQMKAWNRNWKIELIEKNNSEWIDLYETISM